jgi:predicted Zn-dependent protease
MQHRWIFPAHTESLMKRTAGFAAVVFTCFMTAAWLVPAETEAQIFGLSEAQEVELGREAAKQVERDQPILNDDQVTRYVDAVGQRLVRRSKRNNIRYTFKVVNSSDINAFALPGGFIYINRGLLEAADNESELAGVMGHEIGHVVARHSADQIKKAGIANLGLGVLGAVLGGKGGAAAGLAQVGSQIGTSAVFMKFSRDDEREADVLGVRNLYDAGYNPEGMVSFFEKLGDLRKRQPNKLETFFSTHPDPSERAANVSGEIRRLSRHGDLVVNTREFQNMKRRLDRLPKAPAPKRIR